jgi:parallel beta-helix repeat protein
MKTQKKSSAIGRSAIAMLLGCAVATLSAPAVRAGGAGRDGAAVWFVAQFGSDEARCTDWAPCATIGYVVSLAGAGDTVVVRPGVYNEDVLISTAVHLRGTGNPIIDATGRDNGIVITGAGAAGSSVEGFTVQNATFEGILVRQTSDVTIADNVVKGNNRGIFLPASQQTGECAANGLIPGDCGEGLHLWSVTDSKVQRNWVANNAGGILLTDESGPTAFNLIQDNTVVNNQYDCGITIAGHNPKAAPGGVPNPATAGIYGNIVIQNRADRNGVAGEGAGILLAGAGPGTAVYNNQVIDNEASGNGLSGLTLHNHAPGQDLNGNVIVGNRFSNDNLDGDSDFDPYTDTQTTGILLASAVTPLSGTVVRDNKISDVYYGIWTLNVPPIPVGANQFGNSVTVPVFQQP